MAKRAKPVWSTFTAQCIVLAYGVRFQRAGMDVLVIPPSPWPPTLEALKYLLKAEGLPAQINRKANEFVEYYSVPKSAFQMSKRDWRTITKSSWTESHRTGMNRVIMQSNPPSEPPHWYDKGLVNQMAETTKREEEAMRKLIALKL